MKRHNLNITEAIKDFTKLDIVLREFFGAGADGLKSRLLQRITKEESVRKGLKRLTVSEQSLAKEFLKSFSDKEIKLKLESLLVSHIG